MFMRTYVYVLYVCMYVYIICMYVRFATVEYARPGKGSTMVSILPPTAYVVVVRVKLTYVL